MSLQQDKQQVMPEAFYFQGEKLVVFLKALSSSSSDENLAQMEPIPFQPAPAQPHSLHLEELSFP